MVDKIVFEEGMSLYEVRYNLEGFLISTFKQYLEAPSSDTYGFTLGGSNYTVRYSVAANSPNREDPMYLINISGGVTNVTLDMDYQDIEEMTFMVLDVIVPETVIPELVELRQQMFGLD